MKRIITVVGARPQFIKAAMLSRAIQLHNRAGGETIREQLIHTGQHYDDDMSRIFFSEMEMPRPTWQLHCGQATHGMMTGQMLIEIEKILTGNRPDYVVVYGDTNSTLAGALAACKLCIPVVHIEAGLRSFNKSAPEEINRILTDHVSSLLCCPTRTAVQHLAEENIRAGVHHVGDIMYDAALLFGRRAGQTAGIMGRLRLEEKKFRLCTVHRAENTDREERLSSIVEALKRMASPGCPLVFPLHPRTKSCLEKYRLLGELTAHPHILLTGPLGFSDMVLLEKQAVTILTDSGGVQKEAYFHRTPCITLREETEWTETVAAGWNQIAGYQTSRILACLEKNPVRHEIDEYGQGNTAQRILELL